MEIYQPADRRWTWLGLAIALFAMPAIVAAFHLVPKTATPVVLRELTLFAVAGGLIWLARSKEKLGWESFGLSRPQLKPTAIWVGITLLLVAAALGASLGLIKLFHWPFGNSPDAAAFDALPTWVLAIVILRAGILEELFYRGYAIERLRALTTNRWVIYGVPLALFAVFHYRQGIAGITIAFLTGAVLTYVYAARRNLWIGMIVHFIVDFIPNVILPLFESSP